MFRKVLASTGIAVVAALGAFSAPHTVHASNANGTDCVDQWINSSTTSSTENGVTIYTQINMLCYPVTGGYQVEYDVFHQSLNNGSGSNYAAYDCAEMWRSNSWGNPTLGCKQATVNYGLLAGQYQWFSDSYFLSPTIAAGTGFAGRDRSGLSPTEVQPTGLAVEQPYIENWNDL
jgi:hypothetical protein